MITSNEQISEWILNRTSGKFEYYGANICFFQENEIYNFVFPFRVYSYHFEKLRDNPLDIFMELAGYVVDLKNLGWGYR